jgi:hypothetical protein
LSVRDKKSLFVLTDKVNGVEMFSIPTLILISLAGIALVLVVFWLGWQIKPRVKNHVVEETESVSTLPINESLPQALNRYLDPDGTKAILSPVSLVAWGRGQILVRNPKPLGAIWAPLTWRIDLIPGEAFVLETRVTWFTRTFLLGGDEYRNGIGRFVAGGTTLENENINFSERVMMWLYSFFLSPSCVMGNGKEISVTEDGNVEVNIQDEDGTTLSFKFIFNTLNGRISEIQTLRRTSRGGNDLPFHVLLSQYQPFGEGIMLPGQLEAAWEDEYYIRLQISDVIYNGDVTEAMENGI